MITCTFRLYKNLRSNTLKLAAMQVIPSKILLLPMANITLTLYNGLAIKKNCSFMALYITYTVALSDCCLST